MALIYIDRPPLGAQPIAGLDDRYVSLVKGAFKIGTVEIPYLIVYAAVIAIIMAFIWNKTTLGKNMFAIGGNPEAAAVSGVNITKNIMLVYLISGILYGIAGFLEVARIGSATSITGQNYELDAIAACVIGGVSFSGGEGTIPGVLIGVIILQFINYGLNFIGVNPYFQIIIKGLIIIVSVSIDVRKNIVRK
ncbi:MAG: beta-methylgalactoside transporter, partial [Tissierellia bacterium]|nr:beta-methylgalactoside transporter [Tissierellia bacterium]